MSGSAPKDRLTHLPPSSSSQPARSAGTSSSNPVVQTVTVESLLRTHANARSPPSAALDQAVNDINTLTAQNSQLWKLIEKQRNGYNQIIKELERVRGERDVYKARLNSLAQDHSHVRKHRASDAEKLAVDPRANVTRHHSDDLATPRSVSHNSSSRHSPEPPGQVERINDSQAQRTDTSHKTAPSPLLVPPRSESLPDPVSGVSSTSETAPFGRKHADSNASSIRLASSPESHRRPSLSSQAESPQPTPHITVSQSRSTPSSQPPNPTVATLSGQSTPSASATSLHLLGPADHSQHALSRDSRVSLPDEARRYIANMVDSPVPSPRPDTTGFPNADLSSKPPTDVAFPLKPVEGEKVNKSDEFLDMRDDDNVEEDGDYDALDDSDVDEGQNVEDSKDVTPQDVTWPKSKPQTAVDDFPLPPSTSTQSGPTPPPRSDSMHERDPAPSSSRVAPSQSTSSARPPATSASFRALPILATDLPHTDIHVSSATVRPNDRGKDVLSFIVVVKPGPNKETWRVEKLYSDVIALDQRVRAGVSKSVVKMIGSLPEPKLWKDHAPAKVDQRKAALQSYLQSLIKLPVKDKNEVIAFFTSDIIRETKKPVMQAGYKEGYLTKRGKNFGGWKSRYFVLQGPVLEYYESRGGAHLGSITITGAQIGRQQRSSEKAPSGDEEKEYRHAFLIVEAKRGPGGNHARHVLCAESDAERDSWVEMLVRYFSGAYSEESMPLGWSGAGQPQNDNEAIPRPSMHMPSSTPPTHPPQDSTPQRRLVRGMSKDDVQISKGSAVPISQLAPDASNAKLFQHTAPPDEKRPGSPVKGSNPTDRTELSDERTIVNGGQAFSDAQTAKRLLERSQPSSLPDSSPLSRGSPSPLENDVDLSIRSNSVQGQYSDPDTTSVAGASSGKRPEASPERSRGKLQRPSPSETQIPERGSASPDKQDANGKVKISRPLNGAVIPSGFKFGNAEAPSASSDRREKAKSRSFWGFGRQPNAQQAPVPSYTPRAVFGVALEESLDVAQIANLPAIVFRCIQYLEANKADQEEGIYRLSGSSAVIKNLKDRFNSEGDVDLLSSDEFWDPHAIAGLLKSYLRELPASILTRDLHMKFLAVMDFVNPQERIKELSNLIASLPIANYSILRALTAHLILIVQNSATNKMTMRNVGIVFSPTLGIPAGVFSLMLGEFNRVFNVNADGEEPNPADGDEEGKSASKDSNQDMIRRNSRRYSEGAADQLLGLSGRSLSPPEEGQSDTDEASMQDSDGEENTVESSASSPGVAESQSDHQHLAVPDTPTAPSPSTSKSNSKAAQTAANRGLNVTVSDRGNRHSRMMGLPASPRPFHSPSAVSTPPSVHTPTRPE